MGVTTEEDVLKKLESLSLSTKPSSSSKLNIAFRDSLRDFAKSQDYSYAQDHVGNIYISRPGTDRELGGIALTFSLDTPSLSVPGAFQSFQKLVDSKLECDVVLLGWTSPGGELIGRDVWDRSAQVSDAWQKYPDLQSFAGMEDVSTFSLSAIFDVQTTDDPGATASGAPVLITAVRKEAPSIKAQESMAMSRRAPVVSIRGQDAVEICAKTVAWYSEYVAALFGNFD